MNTWTCPPTSAGG